MASESPAFYEQDTQRIQEGFTLNELPQARPTAPAGNIEIQLFEKQGRQ